LRIFNDTPLIEAESVKVTSALPTRAQMPIVKAGQYMTFSGSYAFVVEGHTVPSFQPVTPIPGANSVQFYLDNDVKLVFPADFSPETATRDLLDGWVTLSGKVIGVRQDGKPDSIEVEPKTIRPYVCPSGDATPDKSTD